MAFYVIMGNSGWHDEAKEWPAFVTTSEAVARAKTEILNNRLKELGLAIRNLREKYHGDDNKVGAFRAQHDKNFRWDDDNGAVYEWKEVSEATIEIEIET